MINSGNNGNTTNENKKHQTLPLVKTDDPKPAERDKPTILQKKTKHYTWGHESNE